MCFYAGGEGFGHEERVISSTNRNFENRQGPGTRTHLASPATVAASAGSAAAFAATLPIIGGAAAGLAAMRSLRESQPVSPS